MATPWLDVGALLVARIQAQVPALTTVLECSSVEAALQVPLIAPGAVVVFDGDEPAGIDGQSETGDLQVVQLRWVVLVVVAAARTVPTGAAARAAATPFITGVIEALGGWRPGVGMGPLVRAADAPRPSVRARQAYYPQMYRHVVVI